jgi:hypothetical protein
LTQYRFPISLNNASIVNRTFRIILNNANNIIASKRDAWLDATREQQLNMSILLKLD